MLKVVSSNYEHDGYEATIAGYNFEIGYLAEYGILWPEAADMDVLTIAKGSNNHQLLVYLGSKGG